LRDGLVLFVPIMIAIVAGCSGDSAARTLTPVDLQQITAIPPGMPDWDWPPEPMPQIDPPPSEIPPSETPSITTDTPDPLLAALEQQIADAGGIVVADGARWQGADKVGATFAWLLNDTAGARTMLAAERAFQHGWAERDGGKLSDLRIDGLGEEAWAIVGLDSPVGETATYAWRRDSLVLMVHVQCIFRTCPSDISPAVRTWVDSIDHAVVAVLY
jgi:hypothetical protein